MIKAIIAGVLFTLCSFTATAQSKSDSAKTARDFLIQQEESHGSHPDNRNRNRIENVKTAPDSNAATKKAETKKKKCWFSRKKKKDSGGKPAKDALEDRNTKDPRIDKGPKTNTKAAPSILKDAKK
ncbi:hypothetical protein [Niabella sp.]|uniref:hypothetical protein n=1 Tax=Niabella sp. TaxID=1962976 RepID=UPI0026244374|nr:hypothetical protein [Niabella sp.]